MDDWGLLREYVESGSEKAFGEIVARHSDAVYSACLRQLRNSHLAEETTQAVFIVLAGKARTLSKKTVLSGWLFKAAKFASADALKLEARRKRHESAFAEAHAGGKEVKAMAAAKTKKSVKWEGVAPDLDKALMTLKERNRDAVILRYFDGKSHAEVGAALGISEDAAKRRVGRSLEKLRRFFSRKGIGLSSAVLATLVGDNAVGAAPGYLAAHCTSAAAGAASAGAGTASGTSHLIAKGAIKMMMWAKVKMVATACLATLLAGGAGAWGLKEALAAASGEKLLLGFEAGEIAKIRAVKPKYPPRKFTTDKVTQGRQAFCYEVTERLFRGFGPGRYNLLTNMRGSWRGLQDILNSWEWFASVVPTDWSGYDFLYFDAMCEGGDMKLRVAIEDEKVAPPVERTFKAAAGKWVTLEIDLNKAVEKRGLDPKKMVNFWVFLEEMSKAGTVYIDNIRLAKKEVKPGLTVIRDPAPYTVKLPKAYRRATGKKGWIRKIVPGIPKFPPPYAGEKDTSPIRLAKEPIRIDLPKEQSSRIFFQKRVGIAAYDNKNILVVYSSTFTSMCIKAIATTDGGETWKGLDGTPDVATLVTARGPACSGSGDTAGGDLLTLSNPGCCGYGFPSDRIYFRRVTFNGNGWDMSNMLFVDSDIRHCAAAATVLRLKSGRLWGAWGHYGRLAFTGICAKYSDDGGATWRAWQGSEGMASTIPGSFDDKNKSPYGRGVFLAQYGDRVAAVWGTASGCVMSVFDGKTWSPLAVVDKGSPKSVVAVGEKDIFVLTTTKRGRKLFHWSGSDWKQEQVPELRQGKLAVSGKRVFLFATDKMVRSRYGAENFPRKILCWERVESGWKGPKEFVCPKKPIVDFIVQTYAPENFVPVAWVCCRDEKGSGGLPATEKRINLLLMPTK